MERHAAHPIEPMFLERWSPRAFTGEPIAIAQLHQLFEAARWAPSSGNGQPWRFVYAQHRTPAFDKLFSLLVPMNQSWCKNAGALLVVVSKNTRDNGDNNRTHSFCTGAAWMSIALEARALGIFAHGMGGFDYDRARTELGVPDDYTVECMVAVGHPGNIADLPEKLREREAPSDRKPIESFIFEGRFAK